MSIINVKVQQKQFTWGTLDTQSAPCRPATDSVNILKLMSFRELCGSKTNQPQEAVRE